LEEIGRVIDRGMASHLVNDGACGRVPEPGMFGRVVNHITSLWRGPQFVPKAFGDSDRYVDVSGATNS
jgi:hypothetical protein